MKNEKLRFIRPSVEELEQELKREEQRSKNRKILRNSLYLFLIVAAVTVLTSTKVLPILRIYGASMSPTLQSGEIIVALKTKEVQRKDIVAFYYNNKIMVKRVIAVQGEWIDIDESGVVKVNGEVIDEPYVKEMPGGECDIELPYQVPQGKVFVMGDHRLVSVDSRSASMGAISNNQILGKLILRLWPLGKIGMLGE